MKKTYDWIQRFLNYKIKGKYLLSLFFTLMFLYGDIAVKEATFNLFSLIKYLIVYIFYYVLFGIYYYITNSDIKLIPSKIKKKFEKHIILYIFIILFIAWFNHLFIKYPIGHNYDTYKQLKMGLGLEELTLHHPLFHTMLMTWFYNLGQLIGNHNFGMFLFSLTEEIVMALSFSYAFKIIYKSKASDLSLIISLIFFMASPYITGYVGQAVKDIYFSAFFVLYVAVLQNYEIEKDNFFKNKINIILLYISCIFMVLFRNNGIYVVIPMTLIMIYKEFKKNHKKEIIVLLILLILPSITLKTFESFYDAKKGSIREMLSLPFQQTARMAKYHDDLISLEDKEIIDKILPYEELKDKYSEYISDPVKATFNEEATMNDLKNYLVVWFKNFFKAPLTYVEATARQNIYLLYPGFNTNVYFVDCNNDEYGLDQDDMLLQTPLVIKSLQDYYLGHMQLLHILPGYNIINNMATYIILLIVSIFILKQQNKNMFSYIPILIALLTIILAPGIRTHVRYSFPILWSFPLWISYLTTKNN